MRRPTALQAIALSALALTASCSSRIADQEVSAAGTEVPTTVRVTETSTSSSTTSTTIEEVAEPSSTTSSSTTTPTTAAPTSTVAPKVIVTSPPTYPKPAPTTTAPAPVASSGGLPPFLVCVRQRESHENYTIVNRSSGAGGAFQFMRSTWAAMGFAHRYGVAGAEMAAPWQQDEAAIETLRRVGKSPWAGPGC